MRKQAVSATIDPELWSKIPGNKSQFLEFAIRNALPKYENIQQKVAKLFDEALKQK